MNETEQILNLYGAIATHYDCLDYHLGNCDGEMIWWENINTGNKMLRCMNHAIKADDRQFKIHAEYLNDTVPAEDRWLWTGASYQVLRLAIMQGHINLIKGINYGKRR